MMKVGDGYLIGLRNSDYQMHYLLYQRKSNSIVEIDTQGKRIIWEDIDYRAKEEQLVFPYFEQRNNEQEILGTIIYHLPDKSYKQENSSILDPDTLWKYSDEIPVHSFIFQKVLNINLCKTFPDPVFSFRISFGNAADRWHTDC